MLQNVNQITVTHCTHMTNHDIVRIPPRASSRAESDRDEPPKFRLKEKIGIKVIARRLSLDCVEAGKLSLGKLHAARCNSWTAPSQAGLWAILQEQSAFSIEVHVTIPQQWALRDRVGRVDSFCFYRMSCRILLSPRIFHFWASLRSAFAESVLHP